MQSRPPARQLTPTRARELDESYFAMMNFWPFELAENSSRENFSPSPILPRAEVVSKQATKVTALSAKLEWKIEQFERLMKLSKNGQNLISKQFGCPEATVVSWELHVYPNGKRDEDATNVSFFLRQVGLARGEEPIMTEFQIYALNKENQRVSVCRDTKDFTNQQGRGKFQVSREKMNNAIRSDGSLMLVCEVEYFPPGAKMSVETAEDASFMQESEENAVRDANREMWLKELFTDCVIQVGGKQIKAHKCILGQHSEVFRTMFTTETMVEAKGGIIDIKDCKYEPVYAMVNYIYTNAFELDETCAEDVLHVADKYAVFPLKEKCEKCLASQLTLKNFFSILVVADIYSAEILKNACARFFFENQKNITHSAEWKQMKPLRPFLLIEIMEAAFDIGASDCPVSSSFTTIEAVEEPRQSRKRVRRSVIAPQ
ncbi:unnamed protein product, partial [Mesorhabditis belari]|uniref:BTB domain-containing protein n=1 Tax=Mesorhabditis belari TaxID=2138241 RepID=A0AAF3J1J3_9BILA